jgi:predicted ester cyclase
MGIAANKELVRRMFEEAINGNDAQLGEQLLAPDFNDHDPVPGEPTGPQAGRHIVEFLHRAYASPHFAFDILISEGDLVAGRWTLQATDAYGTAGRPATGKAFTETGIAIFRVHDGRIAERWAVVDRLGVLRQLGHAA